jgi:hypothetical protein
MRANTHLDFWLRVSEVGECWEWTGRANDCGYGIFTLGGKEQKAHRVSFALTSGPIPVGLEVCHRCDNPRCVRPEHLFLGTHADNMRDCAKKGRAAAFHGARNPRAKLDDEVVRQIRCLVGMGIQKEWCARTFGVTNSQVCKVASLQSWRVA